MKHSNPAQQQPPQAPLGAAGPLPWRGSGLEEKGCWGPWLSGNLAGTCSGRAHPAPRLRDPTSSPSARCPSGGLPEDLGPLTLGAWEDGLSEAPPLWSWIQKVFCL